MNSENQIVDESVSSMNSKRQKIIITEFADRNQFLDALTVNPGIIIIKLGAEWCGPCKTIHGLVYKCFQQMPDNILCADIDVDKNFDLYTFLKSKRMVNGIPAILAYYKDNTSYVPSDSVVGANPMKVQEFFTRCLENSKKL